MTTLLLFLALQAAQPPAPSITPAPAVHADYSIGVADVIDVVVFGEPDASRTGVTVDNDGTIDLKELESPAGQELMKLIYK